MIGSGDTGPGAELPTREHGYLNRKGAAEHLSELLGRRVTISSLHRMASDGTGPRYVMILGHASYRRQWLDEWLGTLVEQPKKRPPRAKSLTRSSTTTADAAEDAAPDGQVAA